MCTHIHSTDVHWLYTGGYESVQEDRGRVWPAADGEVHEPAVG